MHRDPEMESRPFLRFGRQLCSDLAAACRREWLVTDGLGGYAMGTVAGLNARRYHGLLMVAGDRPGRRNLGLVALDPVLVVGDARIRLGVHEWSGGAVDPAGHWHLSAFELADGLPRWRWEIGDLVLERELAMHHGRPAVAVVHRLVRGSKPVHLELSALCTWRDAHGERWAGPPPRIEPVAGGFVFENRYRVQGPGFSAGGDWYRGVHHRIEAERGLAPEEDLWFAGTFHADLGPGGIAEVLAWAGDLSAAPPPATRVVAGARARARQLVAQAGAADPVDAALVLAADQFVVDGGRVVAGYPWFGEWSRDTMIAHEGLFLETGRLAAGRAVLSAAAAELSEGMLPNTADTGPDEFNSVDAALWFLHACDRYFSVTGDLDLAADLARPLASVIEHHLAGTRHGIKVDPADGLLAQGEPGLALTWMDARVEGVPVTPRAGKPVEVNALWINGLAATAGWLEKLGRDTSALRRAEAAARRGFAARFPAPGGLLDVVGGPAGDSAEVRPNGLLAISLPHAPWPHPAHFERCRELLLTPLGLRSLAPGQPGYRGRHQGGPESRDRAYHQGTVWPWWIGAYVDAGLRLGIDSPGSLDSLEHHLWEWGLGSVSETADGDPPHAATGCPFQAWSVAELLRARRRLRGQV